MKIKPRDRGRRIVPEGYYIVNAKYAMRALQPRRRRDPKSGRKKRRSFCVGEPFVEMEIKSDRIILIELTGGNKTTETAGPW
jgi:hypothetical protein